MVTTDQSPRSLQPQQANSDQHLIELWLHGRCKNTLEAYERDAEQFLDHVAKPLHSITLGDLQGFADSLFGQELKPSSVYRKLSSVKSLFAFGHRLGYLPFDTARPLILPSLPNELAERILEETEVLRMIALENNPRNKAILLTFYAGGFRVSEVSALKWKHLQSRDEAGQITVFAKGGKTNSVLIPAAVWVQLVALRGDVSGELPVFRSRKKGHLSECQIWRIVRNAAERAGIEKAVSCHWLRHAHASHSLDRGAPIHLVQQTLNHSSVATTSKYLHARPNDSSGNYLPLG
ncbi:MAG TPA: integrase [Planctomycetaceae bacterium]|nr:integrase [Planctomycetaceae bacterium]